jgi:hypothetical protein
MSINTAVNIDVNVDGTQTVKQAAVAYEDLGDAFAKSQRYAEALALQYGFNDVRTKEAIKTAGRYKQQLEELDQAIDANRGSLETLFRATQAVTGGLQVATGAMALMGSESEELNKILIRVQGAMSLSQGLKDLKEFAPAIKAINGQFLNMIKTLKGVKLALAATGIGAIVAVIGLFGEQIGKIFDKLVDKFKGFTDSLGITHFALNELINAQKEVVAQGERELAVMEAQDAKESELYAKKIANAEDVIKLRELELQKLKEGEDGYTEAVEALKDAQNQIKVLEATETQRLKTNREERLKAQQDFNQMMMNLRLKEVQERTDILKQIEALENEYAIKSNNQLSAQFGARALERSKALDEEQKILDDAYLKEYISVDKYEKLTVALSKKYKYEQLQDEKAYQQAKRDIQEKWAVESLQALLDLNSIFQGQREQQSKQEFEREKAVNIAKTLIETYFSAQKAYNSQLVAGDPTSVIRASIAAGFAVVSGLARAQAIRRVQYNSPNVTSSGNSIGGNVSVPTTLRASSVNVGNEFVTADRRVYVLQGDITRTINNVNNTRAVSVVE